MLVRASPGALALQSNVSSPRVSLGLPVFNGEKFLKVALESIARQTYRDFDLLILDNASTDKSEEICREFVSRHPFARYQRHAENLGASENFNIAFRETTGEFFKWIASDDLIDPEFLEVCVSTYDEVPREVVNVFPLRRFIDASGAALKDCPFRPSQRRMLGEREIAMLGYSELVRLENNVAPAIVFGLMRRSALEKTRLIGSYRSADCILNAELCLLGEHWHIPARLFTQRRHDPESWRATLSKKEQATWYSPRAVGGIRFPQAHLFAEYIRSILQLVPDMGTRMARFIDLLGFLEIRVNRAVRFRFFAVVRAARFSVLRGAHGRANAARLWLSLRSNAGWRNISGQEGPWRMPTAQVLASILGPLVEKADPAALALLGEWQDAPMRRDVQAEAAAIVTEATSTRPAGELQ